MFHLQVVLYLSFDGKLALSEESLFSLLLGRLDALLVLGEELTDLVGSLAAHVDGLVLLALQTVENESFERYPKQGTVI